MEKCFGLRENGKCGILTVGNCECPEICRFYKTIRQYNEGIRTSQERLMNTGLLHKAYRIEDEEDE